MFYFGIAVGVVTGLVLATGTGDLRFSILAGSLNKAITFFHLSPVQSLYFTIAAIIGIILAFSALIYKAGSTFFNSGEYGSIALLIGFFGGLFLAIGRISLLGGIGVVVLCIGVAIAYRLEREPPGSEKATEI